MKWRVGFGPRASSLTRAIEGFQTSVSVVDLLTGSKILLTSATYLTSGHLFLFPSSSLGVAKRQQELPVKHQSLKWEWVENSVLEAIQISRFGLKSGSGSGWGQDNLCNDQTENIIFIWVFIRCFGFVSFFFQYFLIVLKRKTYISGCQWARCRMQLQYIGQTTSAYMQIEKQVKNFWTDVKELLTTSLKHTHKCIALSWGHSGNVQFPPTSHC